MTRILQHGQRNCYYHRPFAGGLGAAVYVGYGSPDPGKQSIVYRNNRIPDGTDFLLPGVTGVIDYGAATIPKTAAVGFVKAATNQVVWNLPAAMANTISYWQARTHKDDVENETIFRTRRIVIDGSLNANNAIMGTGRLLSDEKRDAGGYRFRFRYTSSRDGIQPSQFVLTRTAGPTTPANVTTAYSASKREYTIDVAGLQDAGAYTFQITAENGAVTKLLAGNNGNDIDVTADAAGPPQPTAVTSSEH